MDIFCILETYQNLFVGLLGFSAVIYTMFKNAKIQRNIQERSFNHQVNTLRVALKSELISNKKSYELRLEQLSSGENSD